MPSVSQLDELVTVSDDDLLYIIDVDHPTKPRGKKIKKSNLVTLVSLQNAIIYVDSANGSDVTGTKGRMDKPFATLNAAITASAINDTIVLSTGNHVLTGDVTLKNGQTLKGHGTNTVISGGQILGLDLIDVTIRDLKINASGVSNGIDIVDCTRVRIENIHIINAIDDGAYIEFSGRLWILNSTFEDNGRDGLNLNIGGIVGSAGDLDDNNPAMVCGNYFVTNGRHGIYTFNMHDATFTMNNMEDNNGNGIYIDSPAALTFLGNSLERNSLNIGVGTAAEIFIDLNVPSGSGADHNGGTIIISNNQIGSDTRGIAIEDNSVDEEYKILIDGNVISNNRFSVSCQQLTSRTFINVVNNNIRQLEDTLSEASIQFIGLANFNASKYSIIGNRLFGTGANPAGRTGITIGYLQNVYVSENTIDNFDDCIKVNQANASVHFKRNRLFNFTNVFNNTTAVLSDSIIEDNIGFANENTGTATIISGNTSINVNHGLDDTPSLDQIHVTPANNMGSATKFWISNVTATQFTINVDVNPAVNADFVWSVKTE